MFSYFLFPLIFTDLGMFHIFPLLSKKKMYQVLFLNIFFEKATSIAEKKEDICVPSAQI